MFDEEEPGPRFAAKQAAEIIADPGEAVSPVINQLRRFAQQGHVLTRGQKGTGRTASNLFAVSDMATAKILRTLTSLGFADKEIARAAHMGCYFLGDDSEGNPNGHPITEAILAYQRAETAPDLLFELVFFRSPEDGARDSYARIYDHDADPRPSSQSDIATVNIPLRPWLPRIAQLLTE